jgi:hypothetical protein
MHMPGMDDDTPGIRVKADPELQTTKLTMITSIGHGGEASRLEETGFAGCFVKPVREARLARCSPWCAPPVRIVGLR